jgi:predicted extracellular nuclease
MKTIHEIEGKLRVAKDNLNYFNEGLRVEMNNTKLRNSNLVESLERQIIETNEEIRTLNWILENK